MEALSSSIRAFPMAQEVYFCLCLILMARSSPILLARGWLPASYGLGNFCLIQKADPAIDNRGGSVDPHEKRQPWRLCHRIMQEFKEGANSFVGPYFSWINSKARVGRGTNKNPFRWIPISL